MSRLSLSLLGTFEVQLNGEPLAGFVSDKVRALLAYLTVESSQPHERAKLAGLLWPDWPDATARAYLRHALTNLRQILQETENPHPCLVATRQTIRFAPACDHTLDVAAVRRAAGRISIDNESPGREHLEELAAAAALWRGEFMAGFFLDGCSAFEEWQTMTREQLRRQQIEVLAALTAGRRQMGHLKAALDAAWRWVELDPLSDAGHCELIRLLALTGGTDAALSEYERYCRRLRSELDASPPAESSRLYNRIKSGEFALPICDSTLSTPVAQDTDLPPFISRRDAAPRADIPFVARAQELSQLDRYLEDALAGQGRIIFIAGDAGSGKTMLVHEFARRALAQHEHLLVASGGCNERTGVGDPYLPWREIFGQLTGDVETRWAAGTLSRARAIRLWNAFPSSVACVVREGPDMIGTLIRSTPTLQRVATHLPPDTPWLDRLRAIVKRQAESSPASSGTRQVDLLDQAVRVLRLMARERPLLLMLDDLQWADAGSISLLQHLGRHLEESRILLIGACRPADVARGRGEGRHPLESVINELRRELGEIEIDLAVSDGRAFVDQWLATEPNRLDESFRHTLFEHGAGHALFTVELLREMQARGDLLKDQSGYWIEGSTIDWDILPARAEAAIAEQVERLPAAYRDLLNVASVEGEQFTAEVIARVTDAPAGQVVASLGGELDRRHDLVRADGVEYMADQRLSRYRFRHVLFQRYLYGSLGEAERAYLHEAIAGALEEAYGEQVDEVTTYAAQLAWHYQRAGSNEKAIDYLMRAGARANQVYAHEEAIRHFSTAGDLLGALPHTRARDEWELEIELGMAGASSSIYGSAHLTVRAHYERALALAETLDDDLQLLTATLGLRSHCWFQGDEKGMETTARRLRTFMESSDDPFIQTLAHYLKVDIVWHDGDIMTAIPNLKESIARFSPGQARFHMFGTEIDLAVFARSQLAGCLMALGYVDQGVRIQTEALELAEETADLPSLCIALWWATERFAVLRDVIATRERAEQLIALCEEHDFMPQLLGAGYFMLGRALAWQGEIEAGIEVMGHGLSFYGPEDTGGERFNLLTLLAGWYAKTGRVQKGLELFEQARQGIVQLAFLSEFFRIEGELLLMRQDVPRDVSVMEAEACFRKAINVARDYQMRWRELFPTISLTRLLMEEGRRDEARELLSRLYDWFTEGFDTGPMGEAKQLLDELVED